MELKDLFRVIVNTLEKQGLRMSNLTDGTEQRLFTLKSELEHKKVSEIANYEAYYGNCLEVRKCNHRNGAREDTSYYVAIVDVDRSSFKDYKKIKLMRSQTEATIIRKVNKFALEYKQYLEDKMFEKAFNDFFSHSKTR